MRLLRCLVAVVAMAPNAASASAVPGTMPGTGLADTLLIAAGATLVGAALVAAVVMWRKRV